MPRSKPKQLSSYPADWVFAIRRAIEQPDVPQTIAQGNGEASLGNIRARLIALRNGLKQFEPHDSPLQRAAATQNLLFKKAEPIGEFDWRLTAVYTGLQLRPSEEMARNWEEYKKGLRSTPF